MGSSGSKNASPLGRRSGYVGEQYKVRGLLRILAWKRERADVPWGWRGGGAVGAAATPVVVVSVAAG
jgi:hypothetical protein